MRIGISGSSALLSVAAATTSNSGASSPSVSSSKKFFLSTDRLKAFAADAAHKLKKESSVSETQGELPWKRAWQDETHQNILSAFSQDLTRSNSNSQVWYTSFTTSTSTCCNNLVTW